MRLRTLSIKCKECGIKNTLHSILLRFYYKYVLQKCFKFEIWHTTPIQSRKYALDIVEYVSSLNPAVVVEIGCGLADILKLIYKRNAGVKELYGFDVDSNVISAAKYLNRFINVINLQSGTFTDIRVGNPVDVLITVNFIHNIDPKTLKKYYESLVARNEISIIIVDSINYEGYKYYHDFKNTDIIPSAYAFKEYIGDIYVPARRLLVFEKLHLDA